MNAPSTLFVRAYDSSLYLAALAEMLSQELVNRFLHDRSSDGPDVVALAKLLSERLAAQRDQLEALADSAVRAGDAALLKGIAASQRRVIHQSSGTW